MGCGLVRVCTVEENREIIQSRLPEALLTTYKEDDIDTMRSAMKTVMGWADVLVLGPGLGTGKQRSIWLTRYFVALMARLS